MHSRSRRRRARSVPPSPGRPPARWTWGGRRCARPTSRPEATMAPACWPPAGASGAFGTSPLAIPSVRSPSRPPSWSGSISRRSARRSSAPSCSPTGPTSHGSPRSSPARSGRGSSSAAWGRHCRRGPAPPARRWPTCSAGAAVRSRCGSTEASLRWTSARTYTSIWRVGRCPCTAHSSPPSSRRSWPMRHSSRLERLPPYVFAELERKIEAKLAAGVDVISLGIGDPDRPTPALVVEAMREAVADPGTHRYPTNRGRPEFRAAVSDFYARRFDVELDPDTEVIPAIGAKECIFNLNLAFLDPGDVALAADPGYPVYTGGPLLVGAEPVLMPLLPERGFVPDLRAIPARERELARLMYLNYPNNPTGAVAPDGFFPAVVDFARANDLLVVHDNAYSETTFDGYR